MKSTALVYRSCLFGLLICGPVDLLLAENRALQVDQNTGFATAVVVEDQALAHTTQLLPFDAQGQIAKGDLASQVAQLVANLREALEAVGSDLAQIARLNVYLAPEVAQRSATINLRPQTSPGGLKSNDCQHRRPTANDRN